MGAEAEWAAVAAAARLVDPAGVGGGGLRAGLAEITAAAERAAAEASSCVAALGPVRSRPPSRGVCLSPQRGLIGAADCSWPRSSGPG